VRLLFVSHSLPPHGRDLENVGGMQRVAIDLHDSLLRHQGISASALVLRAPWSQRSYRTPLFLGHALRRIRRMARAKEIDAVLFSSMVTGALAVPLRGLLRQQGVITATIANGLDATTAAWPYPLIVRRTFESVDAVLPISRATAEACYARGLAKEKTTVVPLGIRLDRFKPGIDRLTANSELVQMIQSRQPSAEIGLILCSAGRLVPRKGVEWFIANVMPLLPADVHYVVAGEGPERTKIEATVSRLGLEKRVTLLGRVTDRELEIVYRGSDLFLMPNVPVANDMEGFGLVMLEAGMCGLPVIASNLEGIADVITPGENGVLVESGNAAQFRDAVLRYYDDPERLEAHSARSRLHTVTRFGWEGVTGRYIDIISGLLSTR
jgi:phosphatidylinositol alpha-1,6-mannosyltransferase